jgi:hypothetical protein
MTLFTIRTWNDPYNERGQYRQADSFSADLTKAKNRADSAERGIVLIPDPDRICSKVVYSQGFGTIAFPPR